MTLASVLLIQWRTQKGLNQTDGAAALGVTQAALSNWERGRQSPPVLMALEIAKKTKGVVTVESWGQKVPTGREPKAKTQAKHSGT